MENLLKKLGFTHKESVVYLALLEFGQQPAANIARQIGLPKSSTLFILENLTERGYIQKSKRGNTQWFFANPEDLVSTKLHQHEMEKNTLDEALPLLKEFQNPFSAPPKITFHQGVKSCKQVYLKLLESQTEILEFGIHQDLAAAFGNSFMDDFIAERVRKNIHLRAISSPTAVDKALAKQDSSQARSQKFLPTGAETYSSIALWEDKVLLLNLHTDAFGILIENREVSQTLRTVFEALYAKL